MNGEFNGKIQECSRHPYATQCSVFLPKYKISASLQRQNFEWCRIPQLQTWFSTIINGKLFLTARRRRSKQKNKTKISIYFKQIFSKLLKIYIYRVSQKFVPLISCTIIFDQNLFLHEISRRCLFLYREYMFRISVTCFFFFFNHILQPLQHGLRHGLQTNR